MTLPVPSEAPRSSRREAWPVLLAYLAAFVFGLAGSTALVVAVGFARAKGQSTRVADETTQFALSASGVMAVAVLNAVFLTAISLTTARFQGKPARPLAALRAQLRFGRSRASWLGFAAALIGVIGQSLASGVGSELIGVRSTVMDTLARELQAPTPLGFVLSLITVAVLPGMAEETFFRGLFQTRVCALWGRWAGILATALAFGLIHLDPVQGALAFLAGIFLGWLAERFESIRPTMAAHALNNALFVTFAAVASPPRGSRAAELVTLAFGIVMTLGAIAVLRRPSALSR